MNNNIFDYLDWRGDLSFDTDGFCEVDNLILSVISYMDFGDVVPKKPIDSGITLKAAMEKLCKLERDNQDLGLIIPEQIPDFVKKAANTARYSEVLLYSYVNEIDEKVEKQFSAMTFGLPDKTLFIAYRGTDDSLIGWKENFNMSFSCPVPAQISAVDYLVSVSALKRGKIRLGGHSKGGNLAIWAAVNSPSRLKRRIISAYNNDGPGFGRKITELLAYKEISERLYTFLPNSSVVGLLLEHTESYRVVKSSQTALLQHDPFSWEIKGRNFVTETGLSAFSKRTDRALNEWISSLSDEERHHATDVLFEILESTGAKTLSELNENRGKNLALIVKKLNNTDKPTKENLTRLIKRLFEFDGIFKR